MQIISTVIDGVKYSTMIDPNNGFMDSVLISSARDPYQGTYEVSCVIGTYEDVTKNETGPAIVFYGNDGEICYGLKMKDEYLHDILNTIYDAIFNGCNDSDNIELNFSVKRRQFVNSKSSIDKEEDFLPY